MKPRHKIFKDSEGYKSLRKAVTHDKRTSKGFHNYEAKLEWVLDRAIHYGKATDLFPVGILNAWESKRNYWYMNYYQDCNQPRLDEGRVIVFNTVESFLESIGEKKFICPACESLTTDPYECNSGKQLEKGKICDWKVYGLFGDLGKGAHIFVRDKLQFDHIFMPVDWNHGRFEIIKFWVNNKWKYKPSLNRFQCKEGDWYMDFEGAEKEFKRIKEIEYGSRENE